MGNDLKIFKEKKKKLNVVLMRVTISNKKILMASKSKVCWVKRSLLLVCHRNISPFQYSTFAELNSIYSHFVLTPKYLCSRRGLKVAYKRCEEKRKS
jgi:hypothetical protein